MEYYPLFNPIPFDYGNNYIHSCLLIRVGVFSTNIRVLVLIYIYNFVVINI